MKCPNKSHPDYKRLESLYGDNLAHYYWDKYDGIIPDDILNKREEVNKEIEALSNMIMNKLLVKERAFFRKDVKKAKKDLFYNSEKNIRDDVIHEITRSIFRIEDYDQIKSLTDIELINDINTKINKLERIRQEKINNKEKKLKRLYSIKRLIEDFSRHNKKEDVNLYNTENQKIIKKYFNKLWTENNYKTENQAFKHQSLLALKKINKEINFIQNDKSSLGIRSIIKKLTTAKNFVQYIPNWRQLLEDKIENEVNRRLKYKTQNLEKNPELQKSIDFRHIYNATSFFSDELKFEKEFKYLSAHKKNIKKVFKNFDSSKTIAANTNTVDVLINIIENNSKYSDLAESLLPFAKKNNINIVVINNKINDTAGKYIAKTGNIEHIPTDETIASFVKNQIIMLDGTSKRFAVNPERLVLHEIVHSLSSIIINSEKQKKDGKDIFSEYLNYLKKESVKLGDISGYFYNFNSPYGFTNPNELFSETLTNPEFREMLKLIPPTKSKTYSNLLEEFLDILKEYISKIFSTKGTKYANALEQLEDLIYDAFEAQSNFNLDIEKILESLDENIENYRIKEKNYETNQLNKREEEVNYTLKAIDILSSDKAKQIFAKGRKNNWDLNKILTELQISKEQKQIILDKNINNKIAGKKLSIVAERRKLASKWDLENSQLIKDIRVDKSQPKALKPNAADNNLAAIMLYGMKMSELQDKGLTEEINEAETLAYRILNDLMFDINELSFYQDIILNNPEYAQALTTNENPVKEFFENDLFEESDKIKINLREEIITSLLADNNDEGKEKSKNIFLHKKNSNRTINQTPKINEGIEFVFEQTPELAKIGTKEQYSHYLSTIFPNNEVKVIGYHGSPKHFNEFDISRLGDYTGAKSAREGIFFASSIDVSKSYLDKRGQTLDVNKYIKENPESISPTIIGTYNEKKDEDGISSRKYIVYKNGEVGVIDGAYSMYFTDLDEVINTFEKPETKEKYIKRLKKNVEFFNEIVKKQPHRLRELKRAKEKLEKAKNYKPSVPIEKIKSKIEANEEENRKVNLLKKVIKRKKHLKDTYDIDYGGYIDKDRNITDKPFEDLFIRVALINIKNPLIVSDKGKKYREESYYERIKKAKEEGNDSVIIQDTYDSKHQIKPETIYIVFKPEQAFLLGSKQDIEGFKKYIETRSIEEKENRTINQTSKINEEEIYNKLLEVAASLGITVKQVDDLKERIGLNVLGVADLFNKMILVSKGKADAKVLAEEIGHFVIEIMKDKSTVAALMKEIESHPIYHKVKEDYKDVKGYNEEKIRKEALGQLFSEIVIKQNSEAIEKSTPKILRLFKTIWESFKRLFKRANEKEIPSILESTLGNIAKDVLSGDISQLDIKQLNKLKVEDSYYKYINESRKTVKLKENAIKTLENMMGSAKLKGKKKVKEDTERLIKKLNDLKADVAVIEFFKDTMKKIDTILENITEELTPSRVNEMNDFVNYITPIIDELSDVIEDDESVKNIPEENVKKFETAVELLRGKLDKIRRKRNEIRQNVVTSFLVKALTLERGEYLSEEEMNDEIEKIKRLVVETDSDENSILSKIWSIGNSNDTILKLIYSHTINLYNQVDRYTLEKKREFADLWDKSGFTKKEFFKLIAETYEDGTLTGNYVTEYNMGEFYRAIDRERDIVAKKMFDRAYSELSGEEKEEVTSSKEYHGRRNEHTEPVYDPHSGMITGSMPSDRYLNEQYKKVRDNELYKKLVELKHEANKKIPTLSDRHYYQLPMISKDLEEQLKLKKGALRNVGEAFMERFASRKDDTQFGGTEISEKPDGSKLEYVPTYYTAKLENIDNLTEDVLFSFLEFARRAEEYKLRAKSISTMELILEQLRERRYKNKDEKEIKAGYDTASYQTAKTFIDMFYYGKQREKVEKKLFGKKTNVSKIIEFFNNYFVRLNNLALNVPISISGYAMGSAYSKIEDLIGRYTSNEDKIFGYKTFWKNINSILSQTVTGKRNIKNIVHILGEDMGIVEDAERTLQGLGKNMLQRQLNEDMFYINFKLLDYYVKHKLMLAIMHNYRYYKGKFYSKREFMKKFFSDNKNKGKEIWKSIEKDNLFDAHELSKNKTSTVIKSKYRDAVTIKLLNDVKNSVRYFAAEIDGKLLPQDRTALDQHFILNIIGTHRAWFRRGLAKRFKRRGWNPLIQDEEEGFYRTIYRMFEKLLKVKNFDQFRHKLMMIGSKEAWNKLDDIEKVNLKRFMYEFSFMVISATAAYILNNMEGDDDDDWFNEYLAYQANRILLESSAWFDIREIFTVTFKAPAASVQQLNSITSLFYDILAPKTYKAGIYKGKNTFEKFLIQRSFFKSLYELQYPKEKNKWLKSQPGLIKTVEQIGKNRD